jgi:hypothetical protein
VKAVVRDITNEERVHAGQFLVYSMSWILMRKNNLSKRNFGKQRTKEEPVGLYQHKRKLQDQELYVSTFKGWAVDLCLIKVLFSIL